MRLAPVNSNGLPKGGHIQLWPVRQELIKMALLKTWVLCCSRADSPVSESSPTAEFQFRFPELRTSPQQWWWLDNSALACQPNSAERRFGCCLPCRWSPPPFFFLAASASFLSFASEWFSSFSVPQWSILTSDGARRVWCASSGAPSQHSVNNAGPLRFWISYAWSIDRSLKKWSLLHCSYLKIGQPLPTISPKIFTVMQAVLDSFFRSLIILTFPSVP